MDLLFRKFILKIVTTFGLISIFFLIERFSRQLSLTKSTKLRQYSLKEVAQHSTEDCCWMVIKDKVYDLTDFIHSFTLNLY